MYLALQIFTATALVAIAAGYSLWRWFQGQAQMIHVQLLTVFEGDADVGIYTKRLPYYRFVDMYRAAEVFCNERGGKKILSQHAEDLRAILHEQFYNRNSAQIAPPRMAPRDVAYREEKFFPADCFWTVASPDFTGVVRVHIEDYQDEVVLEIATRDNAAAERAKEKILNRSAAESIYRNKLIQISFEPSVKDEYGEIQSQERMTVAFKNDEPLDEADIIFDSDIKAVLQRNVIDFHERRAALRKHGVPSKKGILFYGPPGTGKTYTCRYIHSQLKGATAIAVTGHSLVHVKSICALARMLQPTLVILEDVDLIFTARDINLYSTALGDLMDELDGFSPDDAVIFIMTTNAIERLEKAIKDRPGRISQCIYFGAPNADLRQRYLNRYLAGYNTAALDVGDLVKKTRGTTQAFLKELVFRAVQVSMETQGDRAVIALGNDAFDTALSEMTQAGNKFSHAIVGFRNDADIFASEG